MSYRSSKLTISNGLEDKVEEGNIDVLECLQNCHVLSFDFSVKNNVEKMRHFYSP